MVTNPVTKHLFSIYATEPSVTMHSFAGLSLTSPSAASTPFPSEPTYSIPALAEGNYSETPPTDLQFPSNPPVICTTPACTKLTPEGE